MASCSPTVDAGRQSNHDQHDRGTTLGDLLFGNKAKAPVSEAAWVELVQAIAAGDQRALHALYTQTHRIVFTLIMRIVSNRETAEELTVNVFYDVWRRASGYDPAAGSVIGWILNQARSRAIDQMRFEQRKKRVNDPADRTLAEPTVRGPQEAFAAKEQSQILGNALQALTAGERQAIETAFFSELTYSEVAARLNQPLGTVKTRIRSGLKKLRHVLAGTLKGL
jgi:RNA polymerase sigma-70 factor (ECF subfamily)